MRREICAAFAAFVVMFWNVENLFDPFDDPLKNDDEFTPAGEKQWTWKRFAGKCDGIAQTILAVADQTGELPALIGLAEVENRFAVSHLVKKTMLSELGYGFVHRESPDERGIDVALLYRKDRFKVLAVDSIRIPELVTRDILYVRGLVLDGASPPQPASKAVGDGNRKILHVFVVHLPSRRGGARASRMRRDCAMGKLESALDSLTALDGESRIVVMGDFNEGGISSLSSGMEAPRRLDGSKALRGSLRYHGRWEQIDHFFLSPSLLRRDEKEGAPYMRIFDADFLLEPDRTYLGLKPKRTYIGPRYSGGLSDHLPIILTLPARPQKGTEQDTCIEAEEN